MRPWPLRLPGQTQHSPRKVAGIGLAQLSQLPVRMSALRIWTMLAIPTLLAGACAAEGPTGGPDCCDGSCDELDKPDSEIPDSPCDGTLVDKSGRDHQKVAGRLNDPLAQKA